MRTLASYSDPMSAAPSSLRRLIERDVRITAYTVEPDGVFIYTDSSDWCDDAGSGTFRGRTVREAMAAFQRGVRRASNA